MHGWLVLSAAGLAVLGALNLLNPSVLLSGVFLLGVGFASNAPAWSSVIPDVVTKEELASAVTLGGVQMNISGIIGPAFGGLFLPIIGANMVFALNAAGFLLVLMALIQWRKKRKRFRASAEGMLEAFVGTVRYVRYSRGMRVVHACL